MPFTFEQVFLTALTFYFLVHFFTCTAEISHLKRTISEVPEPLQKKISLAQHIKAHRYDIARTKLNLIEVSVTTLVILALTKFHGIDYLSELLMDQVGDQFAFHWMLPALIAFIFLLVDLPFTWQKEFRLREAYGYTRESQSHWFTRFALTSIMGWFAILPVLWLGLWFWRQSGAEWWIIGWVFFSIYLIFPLHLAHRLRYFFKPSLAQEVTDPSLIERFKELGNRAGISIKEIRITQADHDDDLPPAFAFGHRKGVRIFIRHSVFKHLSDDNLMAIGAHALARNLSHMYFQAWLVCSLVGLFVFMFLAWLAPQSWFLDEIGFKAIGPGPYYGSLLSFAMVALPVLLFPFKLPMDAFLRHLIFRSDLFALRYAGLSSTTNALIELTPSPMRHSSVTLEFFDLLFSHEPSIMARLNRVKHNYLVMKGYHSNEERLSPHVELRQHVENVERALHAYNAQQRLIESEKKDSQEQLIARQKEAELIAKAEAERDSVTQPLGIFEEKNADNVPERDNTLHRTYGMGLLKGLSDLVSQGLKVFSQSKNKKETDAGSPSSDQSLSASELDGNRLCENGSAATLDETANNESISENKNEPINESSPTDKNEPSVVTADVSLTTDTQEHIDATIDSSISEIAHKEGNEQDKLGTLDKDETDQKDDTEASNCDPTSPLPLDASVLESEAMDSTPIASEKTLGTLQDALDHQKDEQSSTASIEAIESDVHTGADSSTQGKNEDGSIIEVSLAPQEEIFNETDKTEEANIASEPSSQVNNISEDLEQSISDGSIVTVSEENSETQKENADSLTMSSSIDSQESKTNAEEDSPSEVQPEVKPKRKRATRAKVNSDSSTADAEKPKRTRTTKTSTVRKRTKKTESVEVSEVLDELNNTEEGADNQSETPKKTRSTTKSTTRKTTTRKTTRKKVQEVTPDSTQQEVDDSPNNLSEAVEATEEASAKPKRTRSTTKSATRKTTATKTTRKKSTEVTQEEPNSESEGTQEGTEEAITKPKRTRSTSKSTTRKTPVRKSTRKKAEENNENDSSSGTTTTSEEVVEAIKDETTKTKRSRATTKKKAVIEPEVEMSKDNNEQTQ